MPDLLNLQTLIAAATSGSFAGAAKRLGISPAMVGRRIQALEQEYGVKLIERTTRTQRLTEVGSRFLVKANRIIDELEELNEISRPDAEAMSGRLRLSAPTTLGIKRLAPVMAELAERHPALSVELNLSDRNVDLVAEGYDLAIRIGELKPSSLIARRVGSYHFVCCASPAYLDRFSVPEKPEDLRLGRCILNLNLVPRDEWPFETEAGESFTVGVRGNIEIDNGEALRTAALAGAGVIYVPVDLVAEDIADGRLVEVLAGWRKLVLPIHAIHPSRRFVPGRIGAIIDAIARGLRD
jgi:DNA-binding transcriptional LysR family regulator